MYVDYANLPNYDLVHERCSTREPFLVTLCVKPVRLNIAFGSVRSSGS